MGIFFFCNPVYMPFTIPTVYALQFVKAKNLQSKIRFLQTSYKVQISGLTIFSAANFDKSVLIKTPMLALLG